MMIVLFAATLLATSFVVYAASGRTNALLRLQTISAQDPAQAQFSLNEYVLKHLNDPLGQAGFFTPQHRAQAKLLRIGALAVSAIFGMMLGHLRGSVLATAIGAGAGLYLGVMLWLVFLRYRKSDLEREILFQVPIALEALILLVESGLGILPALQRFVASRAGRKDNPAGHLFGLVYELSSRGIPLGEALQLVADATDNRVLRHVFLHLDISNSEGGELIPALRNLSAHSHTEWKLSVEQRIKRLENLVVFPVFLSVMGLILLIAAVPLVPVLHLRDSLRNGGNTTQLEEISHQVGGS